MTTRELLETAVDHLDRASDALEEAALLDLAWETARQRDKVRTELAKHPSPDAAETP